MLESDLTNPSWYIWMRRRRTRMLNKVYHVILFAVEYLTIYPKFVLNIIFPTQVEELINKLFFISPNFTLFLFLCVMILRIKFAITSLWLRLADTDDRYPKQERQYDCTILNLRWFFRVRRTCRFFLVKWGRVRLFDQLLPWWLTWMNLIFSLWSLPPSSSVHFPSLFRAATTVKIISGHRAEGVHKRGIDCQHRRCHLSWISQVFILNFIFLLRKTPI